MARKKTVQIKVSVPAGVKVPAAILKEAAAAAQSIVDSKGVFAQMAAELQRQGIQITAQELLKRHKGGKVKVAAVSGASSGRKARTTLTDAQRKSLIAKLGKGATASSMASEFGCSIQTVRNIKKGAGLVKKKVAKKKK